MYQPVMATWVAQPNVTIPYTKLVRSQLSNDYTVYCMEVEDAGRKWMVEKRFSAFEAFRDLLLRALNCQFTFPTKSIFENRFTPAVIDKRRRGLEAFIQSVVHTHSCLDSHITRQFLAPPPPQPVIVVQHSGVRPVQGVVTPRMSLAPDSYERSQRERLASMTLYDNPPPPEGGLVPENGNPFSLPVPPPGMRVPDRVLLSGREESYLYPLLDSAREALGFISGIKTSIDMTPASEVQRRVDIVESHQSRMSNAIVSLESATSQLQQILRQPAIAQADTLSLFLITCLSAMEGAITCAERLMTMEDFFGTLGDGAGRPVQPSDGPQGLMANLAEEAQVHNAIARSLADVKLDADAADVSVESPEDGPSAPSAPSEAPVSELPAAQGGFIQLPVGVAPPAGYQMVGTHPQLTPQLAYGQAPPAYPNAAYPNAAFQSGAWEQQQQQQQQPVHYGSQQQPAQYASQQQFAGGQPQYPGGQPMYASQAHSQVPGVPGQHPYAGQPYAPQQPSPQAYQSQPAQQLQPQSQAQPQAQAQQPLAQAQQPQAYAQPPAASATYINHPGANPPAVVEPKTEVLQGQAPSEVPPTDRVSHPAQPEVAVAVSPEAEATARTVANRVTELEAEVENIIGRVTEAVSKEDAQARLQQFAQEKHLVRIQLNEVNRVVGQGGDVAAEAQRRCHALMRHIDECHGRLSRVPDDFDLLSLNKVKQLEGKVFQLIDAISTVDGSSDKAVKGLKQDIDNLSKNINAFRATVRSNMKGSKDKAKATRLTDALEDLQENMADVRHSFDKKFSLEENLAREALVMAQVAMAERQNRAIESDLFSL